MRWRARIGGIVIEPRPVIDGVVNTRKEALREAWGRIHESFGHVCLASDPENPERPSARLHYTVIVQ